MGDIQKESVTKVSQELLMFLNSDFNDFGSIISLFHDSDR